MAQHPLIQVRINAYKQHTQVRYLQHYRLA